MPIELKMPALSPTMEQGMLARWLVKEGDTVRSGEILAEIETDKATMEYEAVDEGTLARILVPEGTDGVKVGAVIALIAGDEEDAAAAKAKAAPSAPKPKPETVSQAASPTPPEEKVYGAQPVADFPSPRRDEAGRVHISPLARRIAEQRGIDPSALEGSGPGGRIVKADVEAAEPGASGPAASKDSTGPSDVPPAASTPAEPATREAPPNDAVKLSTMRKVIARRLTESKQQVPHIYLTVDVVLDALLALRGELNAALEPRGIKLSVNDLLVKALALALIEVPECNVQFAGDTLLKFRRADISVAVSIPGGLITPVVASVEAKSLSAIATEVKDLAGRARAGKLRPEEYVGGTASISNMGMYGIKQFDAVINPPQAMIMAIGAGEQRPWVTGGALEVATIMSATGSFDHRAIDGADGARLIAAFKRLVENPLELIA